MMASNHYYYFQYIGIVLISHFCAAAYSYAADLDAAAVLQYLQSRKKQVENLQIAAEWREFKEGMPSGWEKEVVHFDDLGRIRVQYYFGPGGVIATQNARHIDNCFDGEVTSDLTYDPNLDRLGAILTEKTRASDQRYRAAIINLGEFPKGGGPRTHRNPFTFLDGLVIDALSTLLSSGASVEVKRLPGTDELFEVRYTLDPKYDPEQMQQVVTIDGKKGWVITKHEQFFPDGKLARETTCEYIQNDGWWVPSKGRWRHWWKKDVNEPPMLEWQFEVTNIKVNDPQFDEKIFDVTLQPGTYVTDNRYNVSYWVGEEATVGSDLAKLAEQALREEEKKQTRKTNISERDVSIFRRILLGVTILFVVALAFLVYRKRVRA